MLFNSLVFILAFLPITLAGFFLIGGRGHHRVAISWLVGASLFFYAWWNPAYLALIVASMLVNYAFGVSLGYRATGIVSRRWVLAAGIAANLLVLGYFKYANFFVENLNVLLSNNFHLERVILPLAISFFTFQQIAYLVDAYRNEAREYNFLHYCLFVTFFPQLIAGPIVHHKEMLPQFAHNLLYKVHYSNLVIGLTIFTIGLCKKVIFADAVAQYSTPVFYAADHGQAISFFAAWGGSLAYSCQLYFDFSGYADMAIGLARMFGVRLPLNFNSPYKATNIIEFWRCWHMTLSRFLRDYLYIPLGGSRTGKVRRHVNLMITMLLGGLWHGAGWNFVIWGALHGSYLVINHAWHGMRNALGHDLSQQTVTGKIVAVALTFLMVTIGWVFFRAETLPGAIAMLKGMLGLSGIELPSKLAVLVPEAYRQSVDLVVGPAIGHFGHAYGFILIAILLSIAFLAPNTQELLRLHRPAVDYADTRQTRLLWKPTAVWALGLSALFFIALKIIVYSPDSEFLYFNF